MKKIFAIILALALCVTMFACGNNEEPSKATEAPKATDAPTDVPTDAPADPTEAPAPDTDPLYDALLSEEGYTLDFEEMEFEEEDSYELIAVSEIEDATAKQALIDGGHAETDKVLHLMGTSNDGGSSFCGHWETLFNAQADDVYEDFYAAGTEYSFTIEAYAAYGGGYLIELDGTSGNHVLAGPGIIKAGLAKNSFVFKPNGNGYQLTFYKVPVDTYIASLNFKQIVHEKKFSYTIDELAAKEIDADEFLNYTYDFTEDNLPDLGINGDYIKIADAEADLKEKLTEANGFKDYAFHSPDSKFGFFFANGNLKSGYKYTFKVRFYSATDLTTYEPNIAEYFAHLLPLDELVDYATSGHQLSGDNGYSDQVNFTAAPVEGLTGIYEATGSIVCTDDSVLFSAMMYNNKEAKNIYVSSINITGEPV